MTSFFVKKTSFAIIDHISTFNRFIFLWYFMKNPGALRLCLFVATLFGLGVLFYLPYQTVKDETIDAFNTEQFLQTKQAAQATEDSFTMYGRALEFFSTHTSINRLSDNGRNDLNNFYLIHKPGLLAVIMTNLDREIIYTTESPLPNLEKIVRKQLFPAGQDLPRVPLEKDIFSNRQAVAAYSQPVFEGASLTGHLTFLISFEMLTRKFLQPIKAIPGRQTWVINSHGIVLDCPYPSHAGIHVNETTRPLKESSGILKVMQNMIQGNQGTGNFTFQNPDGEEGAGETSHVVFSPVRLPGDNYWSIALAAPEHLVLANMNAFRDRWVFAASVAIFSLLLLSYYLFKSLCQIEDDKKRRIFEDQMLQLINFTPVGIVVYDTKGILKYANRAVLELFQKERVEDVEISTVFDFIHPDYRKFVADRFENVLRGEPSRPAIIKAILPGNVEKNIELSTAPFQFGDDPCCITVLQDVTERLRVEEEQRRLAATIEHTNDSILITDENGAIEYVNPAFSRITGYAKEEVIGKNPRILQSGRHDKDFYKDMWYTLLKGHVWEGRLVNRKKNGRLFTEFASITPVKDEAGKITNFVAVKRDITHEVELESQLQQAQKMEAIGTLAGGIAHDFNNILGAIVGFTDISLLQCDPDSPIYENLQHIRSSGRRAADLVQQILTFSRQTTTSEKISVAVAPLVKETLKLLRASLPTTIEIQLDIEEPEGWVHGDPVQIQQIIMNLCTNAFHAMSEKGGILSIGLNSLPQGECRETSKLQRGSCIKLTVKDTGHGIDNGIVDRIFDPFFTTKAPGVGTGMGLSVVHGIIQEMQGVVRVDSGPDGTCFTVLLPEAGSSEAEENQDEKDIPAGNESILVIDDEPDIVESLRVMLQRTGYTVTVATHPEEAFSLIEDQARHFDLVITDQTMPEMTGTELTRRILQVRPDLPVIICTGFNEQLTDAVVRETGARKLMLKPVNYRHLTESVRQVLDDSPDHLL
jgi:PAS domain S-box-containing protein